MISASVRTFVQRSLQREVSGEEWVGGASRLNVNVAHLGKQLEALGRAASKTAVVKLRVFVVTASLASGWYLGGDHSAGARTRSALSDASDGNHRVSQQTSNQRHQSRTASNKHWQHDQNGNQRNGHDTG